MREKGRRPCYLRFDKRSRKQLSCTSRIPLHSCRLARSMSQRKAQFQRTLKLHLSPSQYPLRPLLLSSRVVLSFPHLSPVLIIRIGTRQGPKPQTSSISRHLFSDNTRNLLAQTRRNLITHHCFVDLSRNTGVGGEVTPPSSGCIHSPFRISHLSPPPPQFSRRRSADLADVRTLTTSRAARPAPTFSGYSTRHVPHTPPLQAHVPHDIMHSSSFERGGTQSVPLQGRPKDYVETSWFRYCDEMGEVTMEMNRIGIRTNGGAGRLQAERDQRLASSSMIAWVPGLLRCRGGGHGFWRVADVNGTA
ncbi:hypothetical protein CCHR01_12121 [Colletotrichum chrysophilum]|uniref:Uncharacterized protein n=1 Tax=Colletotrichum chrysophilum TaxID=1836956 RepID=A0AAD9EHS6_9PEZI|nr:hypothetical protein CCHR01_12121 [Colletotrichum chrysophilum]